MGHTDNPFQPAKHQSSRRQSSNLPSSMPLTRRELLARSGVALAGIAASSLLSSRAGADEPKLILGSGSHRYECIHDWLTPPGDLLWGDTQGIAQDSKGHIYISHTVGDGSKSADAIVVFDRHGKFLKSFGDRFRGGGHGLEVRKEAGKEYLYHCDTAHRQVVKTDLDGNLIWEKGLPTEAGVYKAENAFIPTNVAFSPHGDFYVADGYGSSYVHQYNIKGEYIRTFGGYGTENGQFHSCHGIGLDARGKEPLLVITDRESHCIKYFTLDGKYIKTISEGMRRPCHFDTRGDLLLVPDLNSVVTLLDKDNKVVETLGDGASVPDLRGHPRSEFVPGKFIHPHAAKFLHNGDILVVEWVPVGRVTLLKKIG